MVINGALHYGKPFVWAVFQCFHLARVGPSRRSEWL
jgi:hypothetical protein